MQNQTKGDPMNANEWLRNELKSKYKTKAEAIYRAIRNNDEIQFSSPESEAEFEALLREWSRREEAEDEAEDENLDEAAYGPASTHEERNHEARLAEFHSRRPGRATADDSFYR